VRVLDFPAVLAHPRNSPGEGAQPSHGGGGRENPPTDLIKGDLFTVPVLDVEEHNRSAKLVPTGEDTRVASLDGAADSLQGEAIEELRVLQPEVHIAWRREPP
jgi:hypothetical protein